MQTNQQPPTTSPMQPVPITVIVPVYNTEKYLVSCVESIVAQSMKDIEILLIDDGSPDNAPAICDELAREYSNIRVIHKQNEGLGLSRNAGVDASAGEYVIFVDSDDLLDDTDCLKQLYDAALRCGADITVGNYRRLYGTTKSKLCRHCMSADDDRDGKAFRYRGFYGSGHLSYMWGKLYLRSFLQDNNIESTSLSFTQDKLFNMMCYAAGASYAFIESSVYLYRFNEASVTHKYKDNYAKRWMDIGSRYYDYLKPLGKQEEYFDLIAYHALFGSLFVAKQEINARGDVKAALEEYNGLPLVRESMDMLARSKGNKAQSRLMRLLYRRFAAMMNSRVYRTLCFGIRILVKLKLI